MDIFWVIEAAGHRLAVRVVTRQHQALALHITLITITIKQNTWMHGVGVWGLKMSVALLSILFSSSADALIQIYKLAAKYKIFV